MARFGAKGLLGAVLVIAVLTFVAAAGADGLHGIGLSKGCVSAPGNPPGVTRVGQAYTCNYNIVNSPAIDTSADTLTISSLVDTIATSPATTSGNIIHDGQLVAAGGATCTGGTGTGTNADPYINSTGCTLPSNSSIFVKPFSFYTVQAADYGAPGHILKDTVDLTWLDTCSSGDGNCPVGDQHATTGSQQRIAFTPSIVTSINGNGTTVAPAGTSVFDTATLSGASPDAGGTVTYAVYTDNTCTTLAGSQPAPATVTVTNGVVPASGGVVLPPGSFWFQATYSGDANNLVPANGLKSNCLSEPLTVVKAKIEIHPDATNEVGHPHTFTATISTDSGSGYQHVGAGVDCNITLTNSNGAVAVPAGPLHSTTDANGQCSLTFTSNTAGKVTGNASSTLSIGGQSVTVTTNATGDNSGPAVKSFVDANIQISPQTATNPTSTNHVLTGHVNVIGSDGVSVPAPAGTTINFSLTNSNGATAAFVGPSSCTTVGATGSCTVTISSPTPGNTSIKATTDVTVETVALHRETGDGHAGDSPNAAKAWVKVKIEIAPNATNEVGQPHTFTATISTDTGSGYQHVGAGVDCNITLTNSNGAVAVPAGPLNTVTDANGQCKITFTSQTAGQVTGNASSTMSIGGQSVTVTTNATGDNSGPAVKTFVDASIGITPQTATNPVGTNHTFTVTVRKNLGLGGGFVPAAGEHVDVSITNSGGATATINTALSTCDNAGPNTDAAGQCILVISSPTAGQTKAFADVVLVVGGVSLHRDANSTTAVPHGPGGTDEATKTWIAPTGQITPTNVECGDILSGTAPTLGQINYTVSGGKIGQNINPGVFFFWTKITTTVPNQVVTVTQSNTSTNNAALFLVHQDWDRVYAGDCSSWTAGTQIAGGSGATFTIPTPGSYIIGIKYQTKSIAGTTAPVPADITYNFVTSLGGTTGASVLLKKS